MAPEVVAMLLRKIEDEWRALPPPGRPRAVWVALHDPLPETASHPRTAVRRTWLLRDRGAEERDPWEYARFYTVHFVRPWAAHGARVADANFSIRHYEIGLAGIAQYAESGELYAGWQLAGLYGEGVRLRVEAGALQHVRGLWLS